MDALILLGLVVALLLVIVAYAHDLYTNVVLTRFIKEVRARRDDDVALELAETLRPRVRS